MANEDNNAMSNETVEYRGQVPKEVAVIIDAIGQTRGLTSWQMAKEILIDWARARHRESMMVSRVMRSNPEDRATDGARMGDSGFGGLGR